MKIGERKPIPNLTIELNLILFSKYKKITIPRQANAKLFLVLKASENKTPK
tara:strand:+ start:650 stop:802 length:153 start_codon:yes stop_codon:yes gene_type:complete